MKKTLTIVLCLVMVLSLATVASAAVTDITGKTPEEIVDAAYLLESREKMETECSLTGVVISVGEWNPDRNSTECVIVVAGKDDKPIKCSRMEGEGAELVAVGDTITVEGQLENRDGTIQFKATKLTARTPGSGEQTPVDPPVEPTPFDPTGKTPEEIIDAAYQLADREEMSASCQLTGVVSAVETDERGNVVPTIIVAGKEDKPIKCTRMTGDGAADVAVGDTITVEGVLTNYNGAVSYTRDGCVLKGRTPATTEGGNPQEPPQTGDAICVVLAVMATSGMGITILKKKAF